MPGVGRSCEPVPWKLTPGLDQLPARSSIYWLMRLRQMRIISSRSAQWRWAGDHDEERPQVTPACRRATHVTSPNGQHDSAVTSSGWSPPMTVRPSQLTQAGAAWMRQRVAGLRERQRRAAPLHGRVRAVTIIRLHGPHHMGMTYMHVRTVTMQLVPLLLVAWHDHLASAVRIPEDMGIINTGAVTSAFRRPAPSAEVETWAWLVSTPAAVLRSALAAATASDMSPCMVLMGSLQPLALRG